MNTRQPAVAGIFYPNEKNALQKEVNSYLSVKATPKPAKVAVLPHAGYVYSGSTVGAVLANIKIPDRIILLGPKHRHNGARGAVAASDAWSFPFGEVPIDRETADQIVAKTDLVSDDLAHRDEHSLEVEVPFLWQLNPSIKLTPIALGLHSIDELHKIGTALAEVINDSDENIMIIASTDMSHQIPLQDAKRLDHMAIEQMLSLDAKGLYKTVFHNEISMCGVIPTTASLFAAKAMGATDASLIKYTTSAKVTGDTSSVVGYAGLIVR